MIAYKCDICGKLYESPKDNHTDNGDTVIDPVAGSGSTLIAAYNMGRNSYGFECDERFYKSAKAAIDEVKSQRQYSIFDYDAS